MPAELFDSAKRSWFYLCLDLGRAIREIEGLFGEYQRLQLGENKDSARITDIFNQVNIIQQGVGKMINGWV